MMVARTERNGAQIKWAECWVLSRECSSTDAIGTCQRSCRLTRRGASDQSSHARTDVRRPPRSTRLSQVPNPNLAAYPGTWAGAGHSSRRLVSSAIGQAPPTCLRWRAEQSRALHGASTVRGTVAVWRIDRDGQRADSQRSTHAHRRRQLRNRRHYYTVAGWPRRLGGRDRLLLPAGVACNSPSWAIRLFAQISCDVVRLRLYYMYKPCTGTLGQAPHTRVEPDWHVDLFFFCQTRHAHSYTGRVVLGLGPETKYTKTTSHLTEIQPIG